MNLFGPNALPQEKTAHRDVNAQLSSGPPRDRRALGQEPSKVEDEVENDVDMNNDASGSDLDYICDDEDDEAHTSVSFTTQKEARHLQLETTATSDTSPCTDRATTKSQAKPKPIRSTSFRERIVPSKPPERRGWDIFLGHPFTYVSVTAFLVFSFLC